MKLGQSCLGLLFGLAATIAVAQPSGNHERRFTLPDHGSLVIQVPQDWNDQIAQPPDHLPPTIAFSPGSGQAFRVLMTPIWSMRQDRLPMPPDQMRAAVEEAAQGARSQAVERELHILGFQGRSGPGFYFSATDRAPKPGEYKFLTQGIVRVGELSVAFTILTNDGQELVVKQALDALKSAAQDGV